jgi:hypothetical protein
MEKQATYEDLKRENEKLRTESRRKDERIAYLERMLYGSKRDKAPKADSPAGPTLFDEFFLFYSASLCIIKNANTNMNISKSLY